MVNNRLLAALPPKEYERMLPHLEEVDLVFGKNIYDVGDTIREVYFPNSGIISMLAAAGNRSTLDVGMVGREGMAGISLYLGVKTTVGQAIVHGAGTAMRMKLKYFENECTSGGSFPRVMNRFVRSMIVQIMQSSICSRYHPIEERLARWLLMASDRMESNEIQMTHKFLANMLGVRREAITLGLGTLRNTNAIVSGRGQLAIHDRLTLESAACDCYRVICDEVLDSPVAY